MCHIFSERRGNSADRLEDRAAVAVAAEQRHRRINALQQHRRDRLPVAPERLIAATVELDRRVGIVPGHTAVERVAVVEDRSRQAGLSADVEHEAHLLVAAQIEANRQSASLIHELATVDPDLVLLLETDAWWERQLEPLHKRFPNVVAKPQDNTYGMFLLSRLPLVEPEVRFLFEEYVPSIETGVRLASGTTIGFHGVHPKPPPRHDTERRDAELLIVGRKVRAKSRPAIVAGDLDDVAWSSTTRLFQQISGLLDPRIGRGLYSTYNANWPLLRWPIDQVFFQNSFTLLEMRRLGYIGSDHFPFYIALCYQPDAAPRQPQPQPAPEDLRRARKQIQKGREDAQSPD